MTTNVHSNDSHAVSAHGEVLGSTGTSIRRARADATESAKLAARAVRLGVNQGAYYTAYSISYGFVFTGVFLKELLPAGNPIRRGIEDGSVAGSGTAERVAAALEQGPAAPRAFEAEISTIQA